MSSDCIILKPKIYEEVTTPAHQFAIEMIFIQYDLKNIVNWENNKRGSYIKC